VLPLDKSIFVLRKFTLPSVGAKIVDALADAETKDAIKNDRPIKDLKIIFPFLFYFTHHLRRKIILEIVQSKNHTRIRIL
jgi:hypothetical protein